MHSVQSGSAQAGLVLHRSMPHFCPEAQDKMRRTPRKGKPMSTILSTIQTRLRQRAAYLRTKAELEAMPLDVAIDLDIYKPDAARIAEKAVYGR